MSDPRTPVLYLDDGWPESRDYADNYVAVDSRASVGVLHSLRRLLPRPGARVRRALARGRGERGLVGAHDEVTRQPA